MNTISLALSKQSNAQKLTWADLVAGTLTLGLVLAVRIAPQPEPAESIRPAAVYDATGAMLAAMGPDAGEAAEMVRPVPVYDATGAMLAAIDGEAELVTNGFQHVYDATGAMWVAVPSIRP